jgi:hypothetical protein
MNNQNEELDLDELDIVAGGDKRIPPIKQNPEPMADPVKFFAA